MVEFRGRIINMAIDIKRQMAAARKANKPLAFSWMNRLILIIMHSARYMYDIQQ